jgi:hypothetical protein
MATLSFFGLMVGLLVLTAAPGEGAKWSSRYIRRLPDSAFAAIETTPAGKRVRRLPHHDHRANLDIPHLCNALSRLNQVKWRDPAKADDARRHLKQHVAEVGRGRCRPTRSK